MKDALYPSNEIDEQWVQFFLEAASAAAADAMESIEQLSALHGHNLGLAA